MRNKILFIVQLPPPVHGASAINKFITESKAIKSSYDTQLLELKFISKINEMGKFSWKKIGSVFPFIARLLKTLIRYKPQLVYYNFTPKGFAFYRDSLFAMIIRLSGSKTVFHLHSRGIQDTIKKNGLNKMIYRLVFHNQTAISLAPSLSYEFDGLSPRRILLLPNGIPDHSYDLSLRNHKLPGIIFLANLFRDKGILVFMDIVEDLKSRGLQFSTNIIGENGDITASELNQLARQKGIDDIVTISGGVYADKKYKALSEASLFVHPSLDEAFPLTILEAMQASMPVVASSVGAIPDMIVDGRTGYTCAAGNVSEFADRLEVLIKDHMLRESIGKESRKEYEKHYTMEIFESNLKSVVDRIMNN